MHFEITEEQYNRLHQNAKACGMSKRQYLIQLVDGNTPMVRNREELKALRTEIHHIGNNINQIARSVNAGFATREDAHYATELLENVYRLMYEMGRK